MRNALLRRISATEFMYRLEHSKTRQSGATQAYDAPDKPVLGSAGVALDAWLRAAKVASGPLFRRLWGDRVGPALSAKAIAAIGQRRAVQAGLPGDFGGHSLRSGLITEGGRQGIALPALIALTDHRSVKEAMDYFQSGSATTNPAARMLEAES